MAQAFRRLGSQITLIEVSDRMIPQADSKASHLLEQKFREEGIKIHLNTSIERVYQDDDGIQLVSKYRDYMGDILFMAVGRRPNVRGMHLENAGVRFSNQGIQVDSKLRTSQKNIYAAGDVTGGPQYTHYAGWQAAMALRNAFLPGSVKANAQYCPWAIFCDPEIALTGLTESAARQIYGEAIETYEWSIDDVDRAHTDGMKTGFIKIVFHKDGNLLGVTIVAPKAGEMINEWTLALEQGLKASRVSNAIHVYPTYSIAGQQASAEIFTNRLFSGFVGSVLKYLAKLRI
jgi:pyruvate/2-oxoglutarate dehydrogenase complex dihydrolipoamide dehydrogenase (E3) component